MAFIAPIMTMPGMPLGYYNTRGYGGGPEDPFEWIVAILGVAAAVMVVIVILGALCV